MIRKVFSDIDWPLLVPVGLLVAISSLTLISFEIAEVRLVTQSLVLKHILFAFAGMIIALSLAQLDYRLFRGISRKLFLITLLSLILVLVLGQTVKGSSRSIFLFGIGVQPVEFAKVVSIILMAKYLSTYHRQMSSFWSIIFSGVPIFIFTVLTLLQPDFGSGMILMTIWLCMLILGGIRIINIGYLSLLGGSFGWLAWTTILRPYQKQRILTFLDPTADPLGTGYNTLQSIQSVASGGWIGEGVGTGVQSTYVPEVHTDFLFAGFAQEWGFLGVSVYFILVVLFFTRLFFLAKESQSVFSRMIIVGVMTAISIQMTINLGMNIGVLPVTGTPLPLMSYGGSSMISTFVMIGLVLSVKKHKQAQGTIFMKDQYDIFG